MTEKKGHTLRRSDRPGQVVAAELKGKRDAFLQTFFKRGAELTDELMGENRRLHDQIAALDIENASLKTQLASDEAIRDLLTKIAGLEQEKARLLSTVDRQEEITHRVAEVEAELESFANLYVASFQLHTSLRVRSVVRHVRELLEQLVGVRSLAIYFADASGQRLSPISSHGVELSSLPSISLHEPAKDAATAVIEHAYLTGISHIAEGDVMTSPAACVPLQLEDRTVGVIAVYTLLEQKKRFATVDRELFKLVGAHVGGALVGAYLFGKSGGFGDGADAADRGAGHGRLPSSEDLREACA